MCDCIEFPNSDTHCAHLRSCDEEAKRLRLPFPDITRSSLHSETLKRASDETATLIAEDNAPLVVYMKAKKNAAYNAQLAQKGLKDFDPDASIARFTLTTNFNYTPEQYDLLAGLTESIFIQSKDTIKQAIHEVLERK
jgi:hypothetical protein